MQNDKEKFKKEFILRLVQFSIKVIRFVEKVRSERTFWPIADQLVRSATSVGANVTEAQASSSKREFTHYFEIALKSAVETKYWLIIIRESSKLKEEAQMLLKEIGEISRVIGSSILTLKGKK